MSFQINYDEASDGQIAEGVYEVIVKDAKTDHTKDGKEHLSFPLVVRNDIQQKYKNAYIWHKAWKGRDTGKYPTWMLQTMARALQLPNGKQYNGLDELMNDFKGKVAKVKIAERSGYMNVVSWEPTDFPTVNHVWKKEAAGEIGQEVSFNQNDLPF